MATRKLRSALSALLHVIDTHDLPLEIACDLAVRGPMVAVGEPASAPPWGAFSYAPLVAVAAAYRAAGADVWNLPPVELAAPGE